MVVCIAQNHIWLLYPKASIGTWTQCLCYYSCSRYTCSTMLLELNILRALRSIFLRSLKILICLPMKSNGKLFCILADERLWNRKLLNFFFLCGCDSFRQAGISFSGSKVFFQKSNFSIHGKRCSNYLLDASGIRCSHFCDKYFPSGGHVFIFNRGLQHITSLANVSSGSKMCLAYLILHISGDRRRTWILQVQTGGSCTVRTFSAHAWMANVIWSTKAHAFTNLNIKEES